MNLHYGPSLVANNPGIGLDPSTVAGQGGTRVLDPVSISLRALDGEISNVSDLEENEVLGADSWREILRRLGDALTAYKQSNDVFEESSDQWMEGAGSAWHKRGELTLRDVNHARPLFMGGAVPQGQLGQAPEVQVNKTLALSDGSVANVLIGAREKEVTHFCDRHTYAHFDRQQVKSVNVFWPAGTNRAGVIGHLTTAIDAAWTHISKEIGNSFEAWQTTAALVDLIGSDGLKRTDQAMYYRIFVNDLDPSNVSVDAQLEINMLAPTGPTYDAYERDVLAQVV
jgi:hypothetical protein